MKQQQHRMSQEGEMENDEDEAAIVTPSTAGFNDNGFNYDDFLLDDYEIGNENPHDHIHYFDNDDNDDKMKESEMGKGKNHPVEDRNMSFQPQPQPQYFPEPSRPPSPPPSKPPVPVEESINLYDETMEMWEISTMMFFLSRMRNWARDNELFNDSSTNDTFANTIRSTNVRSPRSIYKRSALISKASPAVSSPPPAVSSPPPAVSSSSSSSSSSLSSSSSGSRRSQKKITKKRHRILRSTIKVDDILHTMTECYDCLKEKEGLLSNGTPKADLHMHVMESIRRRTSRRTSKPTGIPTHIHTREHIPSCRPDDNDNDNDDFIIVDFDDTREDEEIVSAIIVDKHRKRVVVAFRGSQSKNDWMVNVTCLQTREVNPMHLMKQKQKQKQKQQSRNTSTGSKLNSPIMQPMIKSQPRKILLHTGFYHSIFGEKSRYGKDTKYEHNMKKTLEVLRKYPGYELVITGLSLGGALCQMFSVYAAAETDPLIPKPVTCYSFASPKIGALTYRRAVQALEQLGHLRLMRVSNENDFVTLLPRDPLSMCCFTGLTTLMLILHQGLYYRKAGMEVKLLDGGDIAITHPKVPPRKVKWNAFHFNLFRYDMGRQWERQTNCCGYTYDLMTLDDGGPSYLEQHDYPFYYVTIRDRMDKLKKYTLEGLYSASASGDKDVVEPIYS